MTRRNSPGFFDNDRDVAALVYVPGEDPDALLADFTRDLAARGIAVALGTAMRQEPDLLVVNRFGGGLPSLLVEAATRDIPVLVAVPEALFPAWLEMTDGLAVRLPCSRSGLERWWHSLGSSRQPLQTLCERLK